MLRFILELDYIISMKQIKQKAYKPRVVVRGNTGTRVMRSRKDKANTRQALKLALKRAY
jgi:hypothetical protein